MNEMNNYYTSKDIEELAAQGVHELELSPGSTLTDFARETAQQFNIVLVNGRNQVSPTTLPSSPDNNKEKIDKYNKPTGCQHGSTSLPVALAKATAPSNESIEGASSVTVKRLIDLMGKVVKRGG